MPRVRYPQLCPHRVARPSNLEVIFMLNCLQRQTMSANGTKTAVRSLPPKLWIPRVSLSLLWEIAGGADQHSLV